MKRLLLATALLSTVMSNDILAKEDQRAHERQLWPRRESWLPQDNFPSDIDDLSTYATRVAPVFGTGVLAKSMKLPPLTLLRSTDSRSAQLESLDADDCKAINPALLVTLDFRRLLDKEDYISGCKTEKCRRRTDQWQIQKPFYVEEPRWVEIQSDYTDRGDDHLRLTPEDPFVLSRGKKIMRLRETIGGVGKTTLDYDDLDDVRYQGEEFLRSRRSTGSRPYFEKRVDKVLDKNEEDRQTTTDGRTDDSGGLEDIQEYKDPFFLTRGKKLNVLERRYQRQFGLNDRLKALYANRMVLAKKSVRGKRSVDSSQQDYFNGYTSNSTTRKNDEPKEGEPSRLKKEADETVHSIHSDVVDSVKLMEDKDNDSQDYLHSEDEEIYSSLRGKRSSYDSETGEDVVAVDKGEFVGEKLVDGYSQWFKDLRGSVDGASYVDPRDKHADLRDILEQPFFISRGKKSNANFDEELPMKEQARMEDRYNKLLIDKHALNMVLNNILENEMNKCGSRGCEKNFAKTVKKKSSRGRRGALDELLAKYDPFFVARGKRSSINKSLGAPREEGNSSPNPLN